MEFAKIVILCIGAAILYGILHDQITARVCVEYFTIGHPPVFNTDSPTLLALGWGIIATWWVGLILGVPMACAARFGIRPKMTALDLRRPIGLLLGCMGVLSLLAGIAGYLSAGRGNFWPVDPMMLAMIPQEKQVPFIADLWSHLTSYASGFIGGIILCVWIWMKRKTLLIVAG